MNGNIRKLQDDNVCRTEFKTTSESDTPELDIPKCDPCDMLNKTNEFLRSITDSNLTANSLLIDLVNAAKAELIVKKFDTGILTIANSVTSQPSYDDVSTTGYFEININSTLGRNAPELYVANIGPGSLYVIKSNNGDSFSAAESPIYEGGVKTFYDIHTIRVRSPTAGLSYYATEFDTVMGQTYSSLNKPVYVEDLTINNGANIPANGSAVEFDIVDFVNVANILQVTVTQLTAGPAVYTFEIWETDGDGYNPADRTTLYLRTYSRDFIVDEDSDLIDPGLLYIDRDSTAELHCRIVNNIGGTASDFAVAVKAFGNPI